MVKQGIKNYFVSLKYLFTPLGTMFLGMMIGFSILLPGISAAVSTLVNGVKELSSSVNLDINILFDNLWTSVRTLNWSNPLDAIRTLFSADYLNNVLTQSLQDILGTDFDTFSSQISVLVGDFSATVKAKLIAFVTCWALSFIAGFFLVKLQIRRNYERNTLWKAILATLINSLVTTAFMFVASILFSLWSWSAVFSVIFLILIMSCSALVEAYLLYGRKKIPLKKVVNGKNTGIYALTSFLIFAISVALTVVAFIINGLMGLFLGLALIVIAIIVVGLNAKIYVKSVVDEQLKEE